MAGEHPTDLASAPPTGLAELDRFLDANPAHVEVRDDWPLDPAVPLSARLGLTDELAPPQGRSSILAIVVNGDGRVLFTHPSTPSGTIAHVLIGGRPEPGESPEETLRREVGEETGWVVDPVRVVGYRHFRHLGPPHPQMADRPHPHFVQPIFAALARHEDPQLLLPGEVPVGLVDGDWAVAVTNPDERPLLIRARQAVGER